MIRQPDAAARAVMTVSTGGCAGYGYMMRIKVRCRLAHIMTRCTGDRCPGTTGGCTVGLCCITVYTIGCITSDLVITVR